MNKHKSHNHVTHYMKHKNHIKILANKYINCIHKKFIHKIRSNINDLLDILSNKL